MNGKIIVTREIFGAAMASHMDEGGHTYHQSDIDYEWEHFKRLESSARVAWLPVVKDYIKRNPMDFVEIEG